MSFKTLPLVDFLSLMACLMFHLLVVWMMMKALQQNRQFVPDLAPDFSALFLNWDE